MIDAGEDVHHPHAYELEKARILEPAALAARHFNRLVLVGDELLGEFAGCRVLYLREIGVTRDQIEEGAGVNLQIGGRGALEK